MFLENQPFPSRERISRAIDNDHTAAAPPARSKKGGCISVCLVCQKAFKSPAFYRKHLRLHSRLKDTPRSGVERQFRCSLCPKSFGIKSSLQRHLSCHTGEKPFLCGLCGRGYTRRSVLQLHVQQVHEERKPFECAACGLRFSQKGNLQAHHRRKHAAPQHHHHTPATLKKKARPPPPPPSPSSSLLHTYASKVKAIVSRGRQRRPEPPALPPSCPPSEEEGEEDVLPDLDSLLEGGGAWGEGGAGGEWGDCPLFTAEDLDEIGEISGNIYGLRA